MIKMDDLIPSLEYLTRRATKVVVVKPTEKSKADMDAYLSSVGYKNVNSDVYNSIQGYGALLLDKTATKGLLLSGGVGIGKSFGVESLGARFGIPIFNPFIIGSLFKELDGNMFELEKVIVTCGDFFEKPHDIVIDEMGIKNKVSNFGEVADIMCDVIDMRYRAFLRHGVKTIITTNLDEKAILNVYGISTDDRLNEMCYFKAVSGKSLRK